MINPHKAKYHSLYWDMAWAAAKQSVADRHQVGAIVVTPTGMISVGWNGMPSGMDNECEGGEPFLDYSIAAWRKKTKPEVIHAERNALDKMTRQGVPTLGSVLYVTRSPCFECCKALQGLGLAAIHYDVLHDCTAGFPMLEAQGVSLYQRNTIDGRPAAIRETSQETPSALSIR